MATTDTATTDTQPNPRQNFGDDAAPDNASAANTQVTAAGIDEAFVADRQMFWSRFTTFTTGAVVAVVLLLIAMAVFLR
jgi:hypothetical protein